MVTRQIWLLSIAGILIAHKTNLGAEEVFFETEPITSVDIFVTFASLIGFIGLLFTRSIGIIAALATLAVGEVVRASSEQMATSSIDDAVYVLIASPEEISRRSPYNRVIIVKDDKGHRCVFRSLEDYYEFKYSSEVVYLGSQGRCVPKNSDPEIKQSRAR